MEKPAEVANEAQMALTWNYKKCLSWLSEAESGGWARKKHTADEKGFEMSFRNCSVGSSRC